MIQLEKDNNDKLYTRIFTANKEKVILLLSREGLHIVTIVMFTPF